MVFKLHFTVPVLVFIYCTSRYSVHLRYPWGGVANIKGLGCCLLKVFDENKDGTVDEAELKVRQRGPTVLICRAHTGSAELETVACVYLAVQSVHCTVRLAGKNDGAASIHPSIHPSIYPSIYPSIHCCFARWRATPC